MSKSNSTHEFQVDRDAAIPMRDGTILGSDIYRPKSNGKYPVIITRHGYGDPGALRIMKKYGEFFSRRGYVYVFSNVRGRFKSDGIFTPWVDDGWGVNRDGYDTVEWASRQLWSNGDVAMFGVSYSAVAQYLAAPTRPPGLKACIARFGFCSHRDFVFRGGAYRLSLYRGWSMGRALDGFQNESEQKDMKARRRLERAIEEIESWYRHLPLKDCPPFAGREQWYFDELEHACDGPWWSNTNVRTMFSEIDVPIVHIGGWFDIFLSGALDSFSGIKDHGRSAEARKAQRLIVGPWTHAVELVPREGLDYGEEAIFDRLELALKWYDFWLKGKENGIADEPRVRVFLMGENRWLEMEDWPPADVTYKPIYFREGTGRTEESLNNGVLSFAAPDAAERPDSYSYDPRDPIPTTWQAPDQRPVEGRMLTYTSDVLEKPLRVVGPVKAILYALSSSPDTDWVVRLCDVWPDGRSVDICDGILRARYRESFEREELMIPGQIYRFEVDMLATAQTFLPGHRVRVDMTSSDFPRYDRNLNTGGPFGKEVKGQVAVNTIFHDAIRASHVVLPIMIG